MSKQEITLLEDKYKNQLKMNAKSNKNKDTTNIKKNN